MVKEDCYSMSKELQEKAEKMIKDLQEALQPIKEELLRVKGEIK
jgi:hypothetical protein